MKLSSRFEQALTFAHQLHQTQIRKGSGVPYISHLLGVCSLVLEYGGDEDCAIAALLHDAIEDQGGLETRDEILRRFGENVTAIVEGCTDSYQTPKPPWKERKIAYIAHIPNMSDSVALVSAADKMYNARSIIKDGRDIGEAIWKRFTGKKEGTLWYYSALADAFEARNPQAIFKELRTTVEELKAFANS